MRSAPPVELPLASGHAERGMIALLYAAAAAVSAWWAWRHASHLGLLPQLGDAAAALAVILSAAAATLVGRSVARRLLPRASRRLRWTGQHWQLAEQPDQLLQLELAIDTERWVLLRWRDGVGRRAWGVASAAPAGGSWHGLRVALLAHAGRAPEPALNESDAGAALHR